MCKKGPPAVWTKEKIEEAFAGFVEKNRRLPVAREMKPQYGLPTRRTFERYMDMTAQEYAELRYPTLLSARDERHVQTVLEYADKQELEESIIRRHYGTIVMDSEQPQGGGTSAGGMAQGIQAAPDSRKTVFRP